MNIAILITALIAAAAGAVALAERQRLRRGLDDLRGKTEIFDGGDADGNPHPLGPDQFDTRTILDLMRPVRWGDIALVVSATAAVITAILGFLNVAHG